MGESVKCGPIYETERLSQTEVKCWCVLQHRRVNVGIRHEQQVLTYLSFCLLLSRVHTGTKLDPPWEESLDAGILSGALTKHYARCSLRKVGFLFYYFYLCVFQKHATIRLEWAFQVIWKYWISLEWRNQIQALSYPKTDIAWFVFSCHPCCSGYYKNTLSLGRSWG